MKNNNTEQLTPEQAQALTKQILITGDNDAARALISLAIALAGVESLDARMTLAMHIAGHAYSQSDECGDALLALIKSGSGADSLVAV